jgi:hypothetical protein
MLRLDGAKARRELARARKLVRADRNAYYLQAALAWHESWRAFLRKREDEPETDEDASAERFAQEAARVAGMCGDSLYSGLAAMTLGGLALDHGRVAQARHRFGDAMREAERTGNKFFSHILATYRAACEVRAWLDGAPCDVGAARRLLAEAVQFGRASGAVEITLKAAMALQALGEEPPDTVTRAKEDFAEAARCPAERLLTRRDLRIFEKLASTTCSVRAESGSDPTVVADPEGAGVAPGAE